MKGARQSALIIGWAVKDAACVFERGSVVLLPSVQASNCDFDGSFRSSLSTAGCLSATDHRQAPASHVVNIFDRFTGHWPSMHLGLRCSPIQAHHKAFLKPTGLLGMKILIKDGGSQLHIQSHHIHSKLPGKEVELVPGQPQDAPSGRSLAHPHVSVPVGRETVTPVPLPAPVDAPHGAAYIVPEAERLWNLPNSLSIARGASGPMIAMLIIQEQWPIALVAVTVSGATDWLDGYLARRMRLQSVLGSYLDPLGDKMLICSVALALAYKGLIPIWFASVVVGRDAALVTGAAVQRWRSLGWSRSVSLREFLRTIPPGSAGATGHPSSSPGLSPSGGADEEKGTGNSQGCIGEGKGTNSSQGHRAVVDPGVPLMQPLLISKANTVLQIALLAGCMGRAWVQWPEPEALAALEVATAGTTAASCIAYAHKFASSPERTAA